MRQSQPNYGSLIQAFRIQGRVMRYSRFVPRLVNLCLSLGFEQGKIMPSRAFCSDESQGYPIILLTKHFGAFPFNHGRVGGIVSTGRHGPHASHGKDVVIIQASHVGFDEETYKFGQYRRIQTENGEMTANCGKIGGILEKYLRQYDYALKNIFLEQIDGRRLVTVDNQLVGKHGDGMCVRLEALTDLQPGEVPVPYKSGTSSSSYLASKSLVAQLGGGLWPESGRAEIGPHLDVNMFTFTCDEQSERKLAEGKNHIEQILIPAMPWIVSSQHPYLTAAKLLSQFEFDRVFRTLVNHKAYRGKKLLFLSGLNIDISPSGEELFPSTRFSPWAAVYRDADGTQRMYEQDELWQLLREQPKENPHQIDLEQAVGQLPEKRVSHNFSLY